MIITRDKIMNIDHLGNEPESILFALNDGLYYYVERGIVENELRVVKNWIAAERLSAMFWSIHFSQGTEIPQELGDYLVTNQDLVDKVLIVKRGNFNVSEEAIPNYDTWNEHLAFEAGVIAGIFKCGEILSGPLPIDRDNEGVNENA